VAIIKCFMLEPTDRVRRWLRRWVSRDNAKCPGHGYHNAFVHIEDGPLFWSQTDSGYKYYATDPLSWPHGDPRWPVKCDHCDYVFGDEDQWDLFYAAIYRRPETGEEMHIHPGLAGCAPAGAMFYSDWGTFTGPDGRSLSVITPSGQWDIDHPPADGDKPWERTGTPPNVTANPSILFRGGYHGWLRNGELVDA